MEETLHELVLTGRGPNTMSIASMDAFLAQLDAIGDAPFVLRGEGDAFSSGLDLDAIGDVDAKTLLGAIERVARRLFLHPAPTVACVNGHAVAGGCLLAQCCDHRVASDKPTLRIGMTGVALGLTYPPIVLRVFRARLSPSAVERVLLRADRFGPLEALSLGLLDEVVDDPHAVAKARLAALAAHPRAAYRETKRALREPWVTIPEAETHAFHEMAIETWDPARLRRLRK